jgi:hypothetical protein
MTYDGEMVGFSCSLKLLVIVDTGSVVSSEIFTAGCVFSVVKVGIILVENCNVWVMNEETDVSLGSVTVT